MNIPKLFKTNFLLILSLAMLLINLLLIVILTSFNLIVWGSPNRLVYIIFFYHVSGAWLAYLSFGISLLFHVLYLKKRNVNWNRLGTNSIIVGVFFTAFTLATGSLWYNATSGDYNNIFWQWSDTRQTMTLVLLLSYLAFLIFRSMIEDKEKKAKLSSVLGIALFPTVPLSYFSAIIFTSLHPLISPTPGETGNIYWDPVKIFMLLFNLIAITILFFYVIQKLGELDKEKERLDKIIQKRLIEE
ncbi:MAG: cytochrome c biogenesis protein CcsA [Candidatus Lokiarchaeota archaeon]|nr:cytochrome c biogenesis protein CcsA [Candidatus Lokiarchaeota archaeon]